MSELRKRFSDITLKETIGFIEDRLNYLSSVNTGRILHVVSMNNDIQSEKYINNKVKMCEKYGIKCITHKPKNNDELLEVEKLLKGLDANINKVIFQAPFISANPIDIIKNLDSRMDVDGFTMSILDVISMNCDNIFDEPNVSPTAKGVLLLLSTMISLYDIQGKEITVVGKGLTSGMPIAILLERLGATVSWLNSNTHPYAFKEKIKSSDVIISCAGSGEHIVNGKIRSNKENAIYINVGMSKNKEGELIGDIDYDELMECNNTKFCNPLLGSTGKLTTMMLILNTLL